MGACTTASEGGGDVARGTWVEQAEVFPPDPSQVRDGAIGVFLPVLL